MGHNRIRIITFWVFLALCKISLVEYMIIARYPETIVQEGMEKIRNILV